MLHLYLHVPFCRRRCSYCDFAIAVRRSVPADDYASAVLAEWARREREAPWSDTGGLATVYFGGGTPSLLSPAALARVMDGLLGPRELLPGAEVTLEANPDDVTPARARAWRAAGINRVSLGVQSFDAGVLAWMHRTHDAAQARSAVGALRDAGLDNFSLDLIYGLPDALERDWAADLHQALALSPPHLSCYALTVEPATPLARWIGRGQVPPPRDERQATEFLAMHATCTSAGYEHYEVSNLARPGARAVHNAAYWRQATYLGLGPSAHSSAERLRCWNEPAWEAWRRRVAAGEPTEAGREVLDDEATALEALYLGLRTREGVAEGVIPAPILARWRTAGWAAQGAGRVRLTPEGWFRLDALVVEASSAVPGGALARPGHDS